MSVMDGHWTDYLTPEEAREADRLALAILDNKEQLADLRSQERRFLELGTSRRRRGVKPT